MSNLVFRIKDLRLTLVVDLHIVMLSFFCWSVEATMNVPGKGRYQENSLQKLIEF